jgi:hypothetical protein
MKTKRITITAMIALLALFFTIPAHTQDKEDIEKKDNKRQEEYARIKSAKIAYISEHIELTPEEAEKFWPLYNELEKKRQELTQRLMKRFKRGEERSDMTNEEAEKMIQTRFAQEQSLLDLKKEYHEKYTKVLPATKVAKLYEVEIRFREMLMERLKHRDGERRPAGEGRRAPDANGRKVPTEKE